MKPPLFFGSLVLQLLAGFIGFPIVGVILLLNPDLLGLATPPDALITDRSFGIFLLCDWFIAVCLATCMYLGHRKQHMRQQRTATTTVKSGHMTPARRSPDAEVSNGRFRAIPPKRIAPPDRPALEEFVPYVIVHDDDGDPLNDMYGNPL